MPHQNSIPPGTVSTQLTNSLRRGISPAQLNNLLAGLNLDSALIDNGDGTYSHTPASGAPTVLIDTNANSAAIIDAGGLYTSTTVEGALQEIAASLNALPDMTEAVRGFGETATQAEVNAATLDAPYVLSPLKHKQYHINPVTQVPIDLTITATNNALTVVGSYTVTKPGRYVASWLGRLPGPTGPAGTIISSGIYPAPGANWGIDTKPATSAANTYTSTARVFQAIAGDVVGFYVYHNTGTSGPASNYINFATATVSFIGD